VYFEAKTSPVHGNREFDATVELLRAQLDNHKKLSENLDPRVELVIVPLKLLDVGILAFDPRRGGDVLWWLVDKVAAEKLDNLVEAKAPHRLLASLRLAEIFALKHRHRDTEDQEEAENGNSGQSAPAAMNRKKTKRRFGSE